MSPSIPNHPLDILPADFTFSPDDPFYYGPATCEILHYKPAAYMAGVIEFCLLLAGSIVFWEFYHVNQSLDKWVMVAMLALFAFSVLTSAMMFYGLHREQPRLLWPKITFIQIEIGILMGFAFVSIVSMSVGIELTNALFGIFVRVAEMERDFGPIWPFNIGVVAFFAAAIGIWMLVLVRGAYDFLLDKDYFGNAPSIAMEKTLPRPE